MIIGKSIRKILSSTFARLYAVVWYFLQKPFKKGHYMNLVFYGTIWNIWNLDLRNLGQKSLNMI